MIYAIGPISGCHINPAVTVGLLLAKKMDRKFAAGYIVAQVVGAILAAGVLLVIAQGAPGGYDPTVSGIAANGYGEHSPAKYTLISAFLVEVVLTFFLVFTVLGATDIRAPVGFAGIAGQSSTKYRARRFRWSLGVEPAVVIYSRVCNRVGHRCSRLRIDA